MAKKILVILAILSMLGLIGSMLLPAFMTAN